MQDDIKETVEDDLEIEEKIEQVEPELEEIEEAIKDKLKTLRNKLKSCEKEKMEHLENLQRAKAEFLNSKKRLAEQSVIDKERVISAHIEKLLPLCDSFDMAMSNKNAWGSVDSAWREGIESIHTQLQSILTSYDVESFTPEGEHFNPEFHEAVSTADTEEEVAAETIIQVLQAGYKRNNELIRPAKVILSN